MFRVKINLDSIKKIGSSATRAKVDAEVDKTLREELAVAQAIAESSTAFQDHTFRLRTSIGSDVEGTYSSGKLVGRLYASAPYAGFVEYGTRPHIIRAKNKPFLAWQVGGIWYRARVVHHPGTAPRPFLRPAVNILQISAAIRRAVVRGLKG
jgi:hypothetical protein